MLELSIIAAIGAFAVAGFNWLLVFSFQYGQILGFWLPFLASRVIKKDETFEKALEATNDSETIYGMLVDRALRESFFFKPLGGCSICTNVYSGMLFGALLTYLASGGFIFFAIYFGCLSGFFRLLIKN